MMQKSLRTTASSTGRIPCSNLNSTPVRLISTPHKQASHVCSNASSENATSSSDQCQSSRRAALICLTGSAALLQSQFQGAQALGFTKELKKRKIADAEYSVADVTGLKYFDLEVGNGTALKPGDRVRVHYDCIYRGIDVVSSRSARLLGGNRTIAEPFEFVVGEQVFGVPVKKINDGANAMFAGQGGPKPPQALSLSVVGMKRGGKRTLVVDNPALGYGQKGIGEMPANATFELKVEVLDVFPPA